MHSHAQRGNEEAWERRRELTDEYLKGDPKEACDEDRRANERGRQGGDCRKVCEIYRPGGTFPY